MSTSSLFAQSPERYLSVLKTLDIPVWVRRTLPPVAVVPPEPRRADASSPAAPVSAPAPAPVRTPPIASAESVTTGAWQALCWQARAVLMVPLAADGVRAPEEGRLLAALCQHVAGHEVTPLGDFRWPVPYARHLVNSPADATETFTVWSSTYLSNRPLIWMGTLPSWASVASASVLPTPREVLAQPLLKRQWLEALSS